MPWQQAHTDQTSYQVELPDGVPPFVRIRQNEFCGMKPKKLKDEDIVVCECKYDASAPESACGECCLNVLTNTECTPGYCPCGAHCRNQKFQKCEYAETKLFKTEGRGWGLVSNQKVKSGEFVIEYCGEVISWDEANQRSQTYDVQGLQDAYIISLTANQFIDATKKGSLARFINHSCQPNCETRKWTVLGETRVGIFAKEDIDVGTELAYDYNFEWYGGVTVRCLCGAANCSLFLGAKSHGFQEYYHVWEDGDDRYTVENIPLYDSAEDEPFPRPDCPPMITAKHESTVNDSFSMDDSDGSQPNYPVSMLVSGKSMAAEINKATDLSVADEGQVYSQTNSMISHIRSNSACRNYNIGPSNSSMKRSQQKTKIFGRKQVSFKPVAELFTSKTAREEIIRYEDLKNKATGVLNSLYDEIRPAIEEHERDNQDSVSTIVAEKWIQATCSKWKSEFDFHFSVIQNVLCPPNEEAYPSGSREEHLVQDEVKYLTH